MLSLACAILLAAGATAVTQPVYSTGQYSGEGHQYVAAPQPRLQYRQPAVYLGQGGQAGQAHPVFESADAAQQPQYVARPAQPLAQPLLGAVDRQIQKAAHHLAGPSYAQQIQSLQLQGQADQAQAQVQRNALRVSTAPRAQPLYVLQQQQQQQQQQQHYQQYQQPQYQQPQYQQPQYQRVLAASASAQAQPQYQQAAGAPEEEQYNSNPSYQFGFDVKDDLYTNYQNRKEQREGDKITGSYSVVDSDGFIRTVTYTADPKEGFKAEVTRKPTDIVVKIPQPQPQYQDPQPQPQPQVQQQRQQYVEVAAPPQTTSDQGKQPRYVYQYQ